MKNLHEVRSKERSLRKIDYVIQEEGIEVDGAMHKDLITIMKRHSQSDHNASDNFKDIFWKQ